MALLTPAVGYTARLALFVLAWTGVGSWIYADATARGSGAPGLWSVATLLFWPVGLYYLVRARRSRGRETSLSRRARAAGLVGASATVGAVVGSVATPPDPLSGAGVSWLLFVVTLAVLALASRVAPS